MQEVSWFRAEGAPQAPPLVAQIFFRFDRKDLDAQDRSVLDTMVQAFRIPLLGHRVELSFVGHADQRGSRRYNLQLGLERTRAVRQYLDARLGRSRLYSSWLAVSQGENLAAQGPGVTRQRMAEDRRVDVYSSYRRQRRFRMEPIVIHGEVPRVRRIVERHFSHFRAGNLLRPSPKDDAWKDFMDSLNRLLRGGFEREQFIAGTEAAGRRRVREIRADYTVNEVQIESHHVYETQGSAEIQSEDWVVRYTWGPPSATVVVRRHRVQDIHGQRVLDRQTTRILNRDEADGEPFVFPPNP